ncbi:unnamed protein product [Rotaria sp. Silwood1]|nr:unnamed protein product [Rotaria sp. Silwood1]
MSSLNSFSGIHLSNNHNSHTGAEDIPILTRHHDEKSKRVSSNTEKRDKEDILKVTSQHNRSRSLDELHSNENGCISINSSAIRRPWHCQLCQTLNQNDSQICSLCDSSKINVYIPIMNHIGKTNIQNHDQNDSSMPDSDTVKYRHENWNDENLVKQENIYRRSVLITYKREADEHVILKHFEKLLNSVTLSHSRFKDETFPASLESLYINGNSLSQSTLALLPDPQMHLSHHNYIQWLRPDEINPPEWSENDRHQWTVFRNPKPNDVIQGALGDCWFITALSVLAEKPEYLMKVLVTRDYNYQGIYYVRLCKDGEWTQVIVDDRLPCTSNKRLAYSQARRKQLWVPLIEKALAKLNGSYEAIIAGRCCEGLSTVTGSPCETLILGRTNNPDDKNVDHNVLWKKLLNARSQRFLMCAMCSNNLINKQEFINNGLLNIHAYSLQDIKQSHDGKYRLVKLRNPWGGTYRWIGDWSDNSPLWIQNPDLRQELLKEKRSKRDGVFWMPFESFVKYFECVDICKIRPDWYEVRDSGNFYCEQGMMQAYYLTIQNFTELDITLYRKISKNLRIQRSDVSLCVAIVNIEEKTIGNYRIYSIPIISQQGQHKFVSTDGSLQPGTYLILPFLLNPVNKHLDNTEFNIAVHSNHSIDLERIKIPLRIEREFLIKLCIIYGEQVEKGYENEVNDEVKIYELKKYWDGVILLVENRNPNKNVHFHFRCMLSQNAFMSRKDSHHQLFDVIPSMHRQIIVTISRKNPSHSFTIGHDFQYNLSSQNFIKNSRFNKQKHWPNIDESTFSHDIHLPQSINNTKQQ